MSPDFSPDTRVGQSRKEQVLTLLRANRVDEAKTLCEEVCRTEAQPGAWYLLGVIHGRLGNPLEAERCCRKAIEIKPDYADAYCGLGNALQQQNRLTEAITSLQEAVRLEPGNAEIHFNLGIALAGNNRLDETIEHFSKATCLQPEHIAAHLHLGISYASKGRPSLPRTASRGAADPTQLSAGTRFSRKYIGRMW